MEHFLRLTAFAVIENAILDYDYKTNELVERDLLKPKSLNQGIINDAHLNNYLKELGEAYIITRCISDGVLYSNKRYVSIDKLISSIEEDTLTHINNALFDKL